MDAAAAERLDEGDPVVVLVVADEVVVGGDQGPEVLEEGDIDRRQVVQGPDAMLRTWPAALAASSARRWTRSGWIAPGCSAPVPPVASRIRSAVRAW